MNEQLCPGVQTMSAWSASSGHSDDPHRCSVDRILLSVLATGADKVERRNSAFCGRVLEVQRGPFVDLVVEESELFAVDAVRRREENMEVRLAGPLRVARSAWDLAAAFEENVRRGSR